MKLVYSDILMRAWRSLRDDLPLAAGLTLVYILGIWLLEMVPLGGLVAVPLGFGYIQCLLRIRNREALEWKDFFWGFEDFNRFLHLVLLGILMGVGYLVGFILLVIPGIWWATATFFAYPFFILKKQDGVESITSSIHIVKGRWWNVFGFVMVIGLVNLAGTLFFLLGLSISLPVSVLAMIIATEEILHRTDPPLSVSNEPSTESQLTLSKAATAVPE